MNGRSQAFSGIPWKFFILNKTGGIRYTARVPKILDPKFFARPTLQVAPELLGKWLVRTARGKRISGRITEVEAYIGPEDLACHASKGRTKRTEILFAQPGTLYVYLVYGMYWCLNFVTERKDFPAAVLIRGVEPIEGIEKMMKNRGASARRGSSKFRDRGSVRKLTDGPGKLCAAFGITGKLHGAMMGPATLSIEDHGEDIAKNRIETTPRIGVAYAKHCAEYPWRFIVKP